MAASLAPPNLRRDSMVPSEMASEAIILMDQIPLACIVISLGHMLIEPSFSGAIAIAYGVHRPATCQLRRLLRRKIASQYRTLKYGGLFPRTPLKQYMGVILVKNDHVSFSIGLAAAAMVDILR